MAAINDQKARLANTVNGTLLAFFCKSSRTATDNAIEMAVHIAEAITLLFGLGVMVGVFAEYALPAFNLVPVGDWPGAIVAVGVAGELLFGFRVSRLQGEQLKRSDRALMKTARTAQKGNARAEKALKRLAKVQGELAKSIERAARLEKEGAEARLETERLRAAIGWRLLTLSQRNTLVIRLRAAPSSAIILYSAGDPEASNFAGWIGGAFADAGWSIEARGGVFGFGAPFGLVLAPPNEGSGGDALTAVAAALTAADVPFSYRPIPEPVMYTNASGGPPRKPDDVPIEIFVGAKPA